MSVTLFDYFSVEADLGKVRVSDTPAPLKYKAVRAKPPRVTSGTFEPYRISAIDIDEARSHGTALVESSILASVKSPKPTYKPLLPPSLVSKGMLSAEQLENIIYAGEQHQHLFPLSILVNDEDDEYAYEEQQVRYGFFIGDGTGAGKGRMSAGIIMDNFNHGRTRAVWLSQSQTLMQDAIRDWTELGGARRDIFAWNSFSINETLDFKKGILFGTYALLRSTKTKVEKSKDEDGKDIETTTVTRRVDQLLAALGANFDGVIILDECHNAGNADPLASENVKASQQGKAVLEIQNRMPFARIVYVSATGAARVDALSYAPRLGLWALNGPFKSRRTFLEEMRAAGTSALEMISRDLKALGRMSSRSLSYEGITYQRLEHQLTEDEVFLYNQYNSLWRLIESNFKEELLRLGAADKVGDKIVLHSSRELARITSMFQARRQSFYAQVLLQFQMPMILAFAKQRLDAGRSVIMQLTHTNEAAANRALDKMTDEESLDDVDLTQRDLMLDYVRRYYPIQEFETYDHDDTGRPKVAPKVDALGNAVISEAALARRNALIESIEILLVCRDGALEMIYDAFGEELVAEVTGRSKKIVLREDPLTGERHRVLVPRGAKENERETEAFNNGPKRVLVFSEQAGGTGRSYHADIRFKNHQPRTHILLEMSWRAESAVQSLGRSHRSNQVCPPEFIIPTTDVPGQKRFASSPARRIAALGAISRGDRQAAGNGVFRPEDNLETDYAHDALASLIEDIRQGKIADLDDEVLNIQLGLPYVYHVAKGTDKMDVKLDPSNVTITKFLNRLLCCDIGLNGTGTQHRIMEEFMARIETEIENAIAAGTYDLGVQTLRAKSIVVKARETIHVDPLSKATTELLTIQAEKLPNMISYEQALGKLNYYRENKAKAIPNLGFYKTKTGIELRTPSYVAIDEYGRAMIRVVGQLEVDQHTKTIAELAPGTLIADEDARALWNDAIAAIPGHKRKINAIVGAITPVWAHLPWLNPEIYQINADDGERIIARIVTEPELERTLASLAATVAPTLPAAA